MEVLLAAEPARAVSVWESGSALLCQELLATLRESTCSLRKSLKTLFWDMFGYGDADATNLVVKNTCLAPDDMVQCHNTTKHILTEATGYTLYATYHVTTLIMLLNALIALMSNTLSRIQVCGYFTCV